MKYTVKDWLAYGCLQIIKYCYPIYASMVTLSINSSDNNNNHFNVTKWILYWIIIALFTVFENIFHIYPSSNFGLRCMFYLFIQIPIFNIPIYLFNIINKILHLCGITKYSYIQLPPLPPYIDYKIAETYSEILSLLPKPSYDEDSSPSADINDNDSLH